MTIRSDPPGAMVYVDDYPIGTTPVSTNFTYYGTRKIRLVKDGYETLTVMQPISAPWYQITPLDFVSENVVPGEIRDRRELSYRMTPQLIVPPDQLLERAEGLRAQAGFTGMFRQSAGLPGTPISPGPTGVVPPPTGPEYIPTPPPVESRPIDPGYPTGSGVPPPPTGDVLIPSPPPAGQPQFETLPPGGRPIR